MIRSRSKTRRAAGIGAAAIVLALAAWIAGRGAPSAPAQREAAGASSEVESGVEAPRSPAPDQAAMPAVRVEVAGETEAGERALEPRGTHVRLVGSVPSAVPLVGAAVRVSIELGSGASAEGSAWPPRSWLLYGDVGADGKFDIDLSRHFGDPGAWPSRITAACELASVPAEEIEVPLVVDGAPLTPELLDEKRSVELSASIPSPDVALVRGRVRLARPAPGAIYVIPIAADAAGAPESAQPHAILPAQGGDFELYVARGTAYWLVACAHAHRPATANVGEVGASVHDAGTIAIDEGDSITGHVAIPGVFAMGIVRLAEERGRRIVTVGGSLVWSGETFEYAMVAAELTAGGRFEFQGLAPADYDLSLALPTGTYGDPGLTRARVRAPASDIVLAADVVATRLELWRNGAPLATSRVDWSIAGAGEPSKLQPAMTDARGRLTFWLLPRTEIDIRTGEITVPISACAVDDSAPRRIDL